MEEINAEEKMNKWQKHVKATEKANPNLTFKEVLIKAKKTYKR